MPVEPQVFDVLRYLVEHRERVVTKEELLDNIWGDRFVSESALTSRIKDARRAVGDDGQLQQVIRTVHGRGYRFVAHVADTEPHQATSEPQQATPTPRVAPPEQDIRFCRAADGVRLAYATVGDGPTVVKAANWLSHLDYDWESPVWRHWWRELAQRYRLVRYDDRGCGLSDWVSEGYALDTWVQDLATVVDAAGLERFALLGVFEAGPSPSPTRRGTQSGCRTWCCTDRLCRAAACGRRRPTSWPRPRSRCSSLGSAGVGTSPPSGRSSPRSSCPTPPASCGTTSTSCSAAPHRRPTRRRTWPRRANSTQRRMRRSCGRRRW